MILAIETSTQLGSIAIKNGNNLLYYEDSKDQKSHSEKIHAMIQRGLNQVNKKISDIDCFSAGIGPGSFTGTRVAVNTVKSFGFALQKQVVGINSLENLANLNKELSLALDLPILSMLNAYKNMIYFGIFKFENDQLKVLVEPRVNFIHDVSVPYSVLTVGDGFNSYNTFFKPELMQSLKRHADAIDFPNAKSTCELARLKLNSEKNSNTFEWFRIQPLYLRASEAEENKKGIKYKPL